MYGIKSYLHDCPNNFANNIYISNYLLYIYFSGLITNFRSSVRSRSPDFERVEMVPYDVLRLQAMYLYNENVGMNELRVNLTGKVASLYCHCNNYMLSKLHF